MTSTVIKLSIDKPSTYKSRIFDVLRCRGAEVVLDSNSVSPSNVRFKLQTATLLLQVTTDL